MCLSSRSQSSRSQLSTGAGGVWKSLCHIIESLSKPGDSQPELSEVGVFVCVCVCVCVRACVRRVCEEGGVYLVHVHVHVGGDKYTHVHV